jgi:hypothetical protein
MQDANRARQGTEWERIGNDNHERQRSLVSALRLRSFFFRARRKARKRTTHRHCHALPGLWILYSLTDSPTSGSIRRII